MVEDRITDSKRIAQLLSSELSGRDHGALAEFAVVDADTDAEPSPDGTDAYGVAVRGERVATVRLYPEAAVLGGHRTADPPAGVARGPGLTVTDGGGLRIESGAAVKRAVDALVAAVGEEE